MLIVAQVSISVVLLVCAAVFVRAQYRMLTADPGFEARRVLSVALQAPVAGVIDRIREVPGVESIAYGNPLSHAEEGPATEEVRTATGLGRRAGVSEVSTNYFATLDIPLLEGRSMAGAQEAVVSRAFAASFWPGKDAVGERAILADGKEVTVVGVARDVASEHPGVSDGPHLYRWRNLTSPMDAVLVRFRGDGNATAVRVRDAIKHLDAEHEAWPRTLRSILDETADRFSTVVRMAGVLAGLALSLAVLGIYGVVAFSVSQRTKEFGIRAALGANRWMVIRSVLASEARPIAWGMAIGIPFSVAGAYAIAMVLRHAPVAVQPKDPVAILAVALVLGVAELAAMFRPAWRAATLDPMRALREE